MQPVSSRLPDSVMFERLEPRLLLAVAPVVTTPIGPVTVNEGAASTVVDLFGHFDDPDITGGVYQFQGTMGTFNVHLFENQTPVTAANFRAYADAGDWTNTFIHRSAPGFVIQGGGFAFANGQFGDVNEGDPIINEPGISNTRGTIAMAKLGGDPDSATNQWFFNLADNSENLDNQNGGFTVFAEVLGSGMDVIDAIAALPTYDGTAIDPAFTDVPLKNYTGGPVQTQHFALFTSIARIDELGFQVTGNTNPGLVTAAVSGGQLTLTYAPNQYGEASITLQATDLDGQTVDSTFGVTVNAPPALTIDDVAVTEGDGGAVTATFTVGLSFASENTVTVYYATSNGTATAGKDYTAAQGTLTFAPGQTSRTLDVTVLGDLAIEPNETFTVTLSSPNHATIADGSGLGTILDDDWADFAATIDPQALPGSLLPTDRKAGVIKKLPVLVTNTGKAPAMGTMTLDLYASANQTLEEGTDTKLGSVTVAVKLAPGAARAFSFSAIAAPDLPAGPYYLIADVDSGHNITKAGSDKDLAVSTQTVEWLAPARDLVGVIDAAALPLAVQYGNRKAGVIKKVCLLVTNNGNVPATGTIVIDLYASSDGVLQKGVDTKLGSIQVTVKLSAGRSKKYSFSSLAVPDLAPGLYQLAADLDSGGAIDEADENNNTAFSGSAVEWLAP